jgi:universal stress protein E
VSELNSLHPRSVRYIERAEGHDAIQKILVVVDPTASQHPCIEKAARLAGSFGSTLELYVCEAGEDLPPSWAGGSTLAQYRGLIREQRLAMLEGLAAPLRTRGIHVITESNWHVPLAEGVTLHALRSRADLVVKDTHRHSTGPFATGAHTDWELIRQLPTPLLLVRPTPWPDHPLVVASVDPCHAAERPVELDTALLALTCSFARATAGYVSVLHALQPPPHLPEQRLSAQTVQAEFERQADAVLRLAERVHLGKDALNCIEGRIPDTIVQFALRDRPAMLAMGVAARQRPQVGATSTAAQVLEETSCDLLLVKAPGFVSPVLVTDQ